MLRNYTFHKLFFNADKGVIFLVEVFITFYSKNFIHLLEVVFIATASGRVGI